MKELRTSEIGVINFTEDCTHEEIADWLYARLGDELTETIYQLMDKHSGIKKTVTGWDWL